MSQNSPRESRARKPSWLKVRAPAGGTYQRIKRMRRDNGLATVCEEASCPNIGECWAHGTATFMVLGDTCTRHCRFCDVKTGNPRGALDADEPAKLAEVTASMKLSYVVLTMVDRDDLEDGGALHVARCVSAMKASTPGLLVETLVGDFRARREALRIVAESEADVLAHNVETTRPLTRKVRDGKSSYDQSLAALGLLKELAPRKLTKSSIMLGLGESEDEVLETLQDLRAVGVDLVTLGQYLQPSPKHLEVQEYIEPAVFDAWAEQAKELGFLHCASGPLVRSSYKAGELFTETYLRERMRHLEPFGV